MKKYLLCTLFLVSVLAGCGTEPVSTTPDQKDKSQRILTDAEFIAEEYKVVELTEKLDLAGCSQLEAGNLQILCSDSINYKLAEKESDKKYCNKIIDSAQRIECETVIKGQN